MLIDLIGYRRFGHNESDEPAYTQPEMYAKIKTKKRVAELWAERLVADGVVSQEEVDAPGAGGVGQPDAPAPAAEGEDRRAPPSTAPRSTAPASTSSTARPAPRSTPPCRPTRLRELGEELLRVPDGFTVHPKLVKQLERRREALAEERPTGGDRLGARRGARVRVAAGRGHADPPDRPGHRARHLQPAPPGPARRQDRPDGLPDPEPARRAGAARAAQQPAVGAGVPGLRVRLQPGGAGDARAVGGAVRRLRQLRAGDRRPVHRLGPGQVGADLAPDAAAAARLRGLGPRALLGAPGALPALAAEGNIRVASPTTPAQYFHLLRRQARIAKQRPLDRDDAQVAAAPAAGDQLDRRPGREHALSAGARRAGRRGRAGHAAGAVHRQDLLRPRRAPRPRRATTGWRSAASSCCTRSPRARSSS